MKTPRTSAARTGSTEGGYARRFVRFQVVMNGQAGDEW
jgi:hypothetical protein